MTSKRIIFDTLSYAKSLETEGIIKGDVYARSLAEALQENLYTQGETDKMIDASLKEFSERTQIMMREFSEKHNKMEKEFQEVTSKDRAKHEQEVAKLTAEMNMRFSETINHVVSRLTINMGIFGGVLTLMNGVFHYLH